MTANDNDTMRDPGLVGVEPDLVELYQKVWRRKRDAMAQNYRGPEQIARGAEVVRRCVELIREIQPMGHRPAAEQLDFVQRVREENVDLLR